MGTYSSKDVVGGADGSLDAGIGAGAGGGIPTRQHSAQQQPYYGRPAGSTPRSGAGVPIGPSAGMGISPFDSSSAGGAPTMVVPGTSVGSKPQRIGGEAPGGSSSALMGAEGVHALQVVGDETNDTGIDPHARAVMLCPVSWNLKNTILLSYVALNLWHHNSSDGISVGAWRPQCVRHGNVQQLGKAGAYTYVRFISLRTSN
jgi:hypothetical protein